MGHCVSKQSAAEKGIGQTTTRKSVINFREKSESHSENSPSYPGPTAHEMTGGVLLARAYSPTELNANEEVLFNSKLFSLLPDGTCKRLAYGMKLFVLNTGKIVYAENNRGSNLYILGKGKIMRTQYKEPAGAIHSWELFGETGFDLINNQRKFTLRTLEKCEIWVLSLFGYEEIVQDIRFERKGVIYNSIRLLPIFDHLTKTQKLELIGKGDELKVEKGHAIIEENKEGKHCYIIIEGEVDVSIEGKQIRTLHSGDYFGELALVHKIPRTARIVSTGYTILFAIDFHILSKFFGDRLYSIFYENTIRYSFEHSKYFHLFQTEEIQRIIKYCQISLYSHGDLVIEEQTAQGRGVWVILQGSLISRNKTYGAFHMFGESSMVEDAPNKEFHNKTISKNNSVVAYISKSSFETALNKDVSSALNANKIFKILLKIKVFNDLKAEKLRLISQEMQLRCYPMHTNIITEGEQGNELFIIRSGQILISKNDVLIKHIEHPDYFGERAILLNEPRTATVRALTDTSCWVLERLQFLSIIDQKAQLHLLNRIVVQDSTIELPDLCVVEMLKQSVFNTFFVVVKKNQNKYILRTATRKRIAFHKLHDAILIEKQVFLALNHPMIMRMIKTFKDDIRLYFLFEYVKGDSLSELLDHHKTFRPGPAKFYSSCAFLIIEHFHQKNILCRALTPDNLMIDPEGYPKLISMHHSKIHSKKNLTVIGSPHYMAPEMVCGTPYSFAVDYWVFGVLLYELLTRKVPFGAAAASPFEVYQEILTCNLVLPSAVSEAAPLLTQLLSVKPSSRGTLETIKSASWFSEANWDELVLKNVAAPDVPSPVNSESAIAHALQYFPDSLFDILLNFEQEDKVLGPSNSRLPSEDWDAKF